MKKGDRVAVYLPTGERLGKGVLLGRAEMVANNELGEYMRKVRMDDGLILSINRSAIRRIKPRAS